MNYQARIKQAYDRLKAKIESGNIDNGIFTEIDRQHLFSAKRDELYELAKAKLNPKPKKSEKAKAKPKLGESDKVEEIPEVKPPEKPEGENG